MDNAPAVALDGVHKRFGSLTAVADLDLRIGRGETVALLGPNGAGKTTTINMLLGLVRPDPGRAQLFGAPPSRAIEHGRVGTVLQDAMFLPNATVRDFVELARALYPNSSPLAEILALAGLSERANARLNKLSGGEAKRARFAFALAGDPDLLVPDEPTAAMDVAGRQAFWAAMHRYADRGRTVLFATHYLGVAEVGFGDAVVDAARDAKPDVALLDIEMPGSSGLDAAAALRDAVPDCKVLILTTFGRPGYLRRAMEAGARGFLVKDAPVEELAAAIRRVLAGENVVDPTLAAAALSAGPSPLTERERQVLSAAVDGSTIADIAARLFLSKSTVRNYLSSAIGKTGSRNRMEAIASARSQGWL